ncbi:hypothetical protein DM860_001114 [Cuscuta australis]|uniref:Uncharacterized protein n=1 Tax=Cuscuta australis TaxID=267555 RepID=A0A328DT25_9ASTE|nr:hypothetical protein DM860_001114 [Cuscuta australis]
MAYAALVSLHHTIQRLLYSSSISIASPGLDLVKLRELDFLEKVVERLDSRSCMARENDRESVDDDVEGKIREAEFKLKDVLESHVSYQFLSQFGSWRDKGRGLVLSLDSEEMHQEMKSFTEMVNFVKNYSSEIAVHEEEEEEEEENDYSASGVVDSGAKKSSEIVGLSEERRRIKSSLTSWMTEQLCVASLEGMAGIGKTTLAKEVYEDPFVCKYFDARVWISIGQKYQLKRVLLSILFQMNPSFDRNLREGDDELIGYLNESLKGKRYLIVLDDVWSLDIRDLVNKVLPEENNGSRVLLTTRLHNVSTFSYATSIHRVRFMNKEESWSLLRHNIFGDEWCPPLLENVGKKIAAICDGLPLVVVIVVDTLSKAAEKSLEYWKEVAEKKNSIFKDAYDKMSEVLYPSYKQLPQHLKVHFLYMGIFPENYQISTSKLFQLWVAEGFLKISQAKINKIQTVEWLEELVSRNIIIIPERDSNNHSFKTCKLQSAFWHLCSRESGKNKFFHIINSYSDGFAEGIKDQHRLCIQNGILFGIKDVHDSMASISALRSLLCTGPSHPYPVPLCFDLKLLRVLDAIAIRIYEFPVEVLKLVHLRYLALTCNADLPPSISRLGNLCFLIVRHDLRLKSPGDWPYLPKEIWDMQELVHLQITGGNLPNPDGGAVLENLLTLTDVSAQSCSKEVLQGVPNLKKLGIEIELEPDADAEYDPFSFFDHISHLYSLTSLKCVVGNPELTRGIPTPSALPNFPKRLNKLSLSGFGYPWECLRKIAVGMHNLEVLKLRCYAFQGLEWGVRQGEFLKLKFLLLEDSDLVRWEADDTSCFPFLDRVILRHCYGLEEIPWKRLTSVREVEPATPQH